jgi:diguanylate cyclase (GGDEF)-like protein
MIDRLDSSTKVLVLAGVIALMVLVNGAFAVFWTTNLRREFVESRGEAAPFAIAATKIVMLHEDEAGHFDKAWRVGAADSDLPDETTRETQQKEFFDANARVDDMLREQSLLAESASAAPDRSLSPWANSEAVRLLDEMAREHKAYVELAQRAYAYQQAGDPEAAAGVRAHVDAAEQRFEEASTALVGLAQRLVAAADRRLRRAETGLQHTLITFTAAAFAVGLWMMYLIRRINHARRAAEDEIRRLALHDPLTGLANRRFFDEQLELAIEEARRFGDPLSLCLCDLDHFKKINDEHGHHVGDAILRRFAELARDGVRSVDLAGRYGGDEFVIFFRRTNAAEARVVLERICENLRASAQADARGDLCRATAACGVADFQPHYPNAQALFVAADQALYRAKAAGRDCIAVLEE